MNNKIDLNKKHVCQTGLRASLEYSMMLHWQNSRQWFTCSNPTTTRYPQSEHILHKITDQNNWLKNDMKKLLNIDFESPLHSREI